MKNLDHDHGLAMSTIKMGDLFLTKENPHGRSPVIGFFEYMDGTKTITRFSTNTAFFMPVPVGTIGIYFRKNISQTMTTYWSRFHEVWIEGKLCVIHEDFIDPLHKGK